jgi:sec-independent protein translocase protein TatB
MSFSETVFLFVLALLVFGPKKLPEIARQVGKALNELRRASNEFKAQIEAEISHLEVEERRKQEQPKILPPAEPPSGAVQSSRFAPPSEALPTVNAPAEKPSNA